MVDTEPEDDGGDITLEHVDGKWAWKKPLQDGTFDYIPLKGDIRFNNVVFGYTDEKVILKNISLYVGCVKSAVTYIVYNRTREKVRILQHNAETAP